MSDLAQVWQRNLANFRQAFPAYAEVPDVTLLDAIHRNFLPGMDDFWDRLETPGGEIPNVGGPGSRQMSPLDVMFQSLDAQIRQERETDARGDRPLTEKLSDRTRSILQGVTRQHWDEMVGFATWLESLAMGESLEAADAARQERVKWERSQGEAFAQESPVQNLLLEGVGAAAPYAFPPLRGVAGRAAQLPIQAQAPLWGGMGGVDAFLYGHGAADQGGAFNPERLAAGQDLGGVGVAGGYVAPVLGAAAGPVLNTAQRFAAQPGRSSATRLVDRALDESGATRGEVAAQMRGNPNLMPLDVNSALLNRAQGIAAQPGQGQTVLTNALRERQVRMPTIVREVIAGTLGEVPDVTVVLRGIKEAIRGVGEQFGPVLDAAVPINVAPIAAQIDARLPQGWRYSNVLTNDQKELAALRNRIVSPRGEQLVDANVLHGIQSEVRESIDDLITSASGADVRLARQLTPVRQLIIDTIDTATNGRYRPLQQQYATENSVQRAFDRGTQILDNPRTGQASLYARPEFWEEWVGTLTPQELEAARLGALTRIDNQMGAARNTARAGAAIPGVDFNNDRLALLFGADEVEALTRRAGEATNMMNNTNVLLNNSQTAQRTLAQQEVGVPSVASRGGLGLGGATAVLAGLSMAAPEVLGAAGPIGTGIAGTLALGNAARRLGVQKVAQGRNTNFARAASETGPEAAARFEQGQLPPFAPTGQLPGIIAPLLTSRVPPVLATYDAPVRR